MPAKKTEKTRRTHRLPETRVTENELDTIRTKAKDAGLSQSEYQRRMCLQGKIIMRQSIADVGMISELKRIGANINQLARWAHIHQECDNVLLRKSLASLDEQLDRLMELRV